MRIKADKQRMIRAGTELLEQTRELRKAGDEVEAATLRLTAYTQMDTCIRELRKQREAVRLAAAKLTLLSTALRDIATIYDRTEIDAAEALDGGPNPFGRSDEFYVTSFPDKYKKLFRELL